jgi:hypothetical protein
MSTARAAVAFLEQVLAGALSPTASQFLADATRELARGATSARLGEVLALASRHAGRHLVAYDQALLDQGRAVTGDFDPERWTVLDVLRVRLVLGFAGLEGAEGERALGEAFRYADEGETCALLRALALVPAPERFLWRATEGCRSNMRSVFEAAATDSPVPVRHFDDVAWRQAVVKSLFVGAPTWRIRGLDRRLDPELARMALDYADERRSAGRHVPPALWALLGSHLDGRALHSIEAEIAAGPETARAGAYLALARGRRADLLDAHLSTEPAALALAVGRSALAGRHGQEAFAPLS